MTGRTKSPPACPTTTVGRSGFSCACWSSGLAFRKQSKVNWCPLCATVLANEQVIDGCCWRHEDTVVEQRDLEQWFLRTTNYAQELLDGLDNLPGWPEKVRTMQRNWIGRSEGATIEFAARSSRRAETGRDRGKVPVPAPQGFVAGAPLADGRRADPGLHHAPGYHLRRHQPATRAPAPVGPSSSPRPTNGWLLKSPRWSKSRRRPAKQAMRGPSTSAAVFTGHYAINPFSGERVPIWVANYILLEYGTGAVMSVPAHDERDFEFAKKYGLEVRIVVLPRRSGEPPAAGKPDEPVLPYTEEDSLLMNSGEYNGLGCQEAREKLAAFAEEHGFGKPTVTYRLKDWGSQPPALLGRAHPRALLPQGRHRARAR